jgi:hypothetical protein
MFLLSFLNKTVFWLSEQYNLFTDVYKIGKAKESRFPICASRVAALQCAPNSTSGARGPFRFAQEDKFDVCNFGALKRANTWIVTLLFASLAQAN